MWGMNVQRLGLGERVSEKAVVRGLNLRLKAKVRYNRFKTRGVT